MKIIVITFIMLFNIYKAFTQTLPIKPQFMSEVDYKDKKLLLKNSIFKIKNENAEDAHYYNVFVLLYDLEAPIDTCLNYFRQAIRVAPVSACNSSFIRSGNFKFHFHKTDKDSLILSKMKPICDSVWNTLDSNLIKILKEVEINDQKYRKNIVDSYWVTDGKKLMEKQEELDKINTKILTKIIDSLGYPGRNIVGLELEDVAFLVIQHSDLVTQEKYLNIIKEASENHQLSMFAYPLLYDRICMNKNLPQLYGTQIIYDHRKEKQTLYKIDDPIKVNERRKQYGLSTIEYKIKSNGLE
jgi:hypothetical protein